MEKKFSKANKFTLNNSLKYWTCSLVLSSSAFLMISCGALKDAWTKGKFGNEPESIFQTYSTQYCSLDLKNLRNKLKIHCEKVKDFLYADQPSCQKQKVPVAASFPDQDLKLPLCQERPVLQLRDRDSLRILVYGDSGVGQNSSKGYEQVRVAQAMAEVCKKSPGGCDFGISVGDNIYPSGTKDVWDPKFKSRFEDIYHVLEDLPVYSVVGNHDYHGNVTSQVEYSLFSTRWRMPGKFYSIQGLPDWLHLMGVDSQGIIGYNETPLTATEQLDFVCQELEGKQGWSFLFAHHPVLSSGKHGGTQAMTDWMHTVDSQCGLDVYLAGHEHHQEHIWTTGYDTIIQGAGGTRLRKVVERTGVPQEGSAANGTAGWIQRHVVSAHGFAILEISKSEMLVRFYDIQKWLPNRDGFQFSPDPKDSVYNCQMKKGNPAGCEPIEL